MKVYNRSAERYEKAEKVTCPYCKGFGGVSGEDRPCPICLNKDYGRVWRSTEGSGWMRPLYNRIEDSVLF
jgi:hypothetical protein